MSAATTTETQTTMSAALVRATTELEPDSAITLRTAFETMFAQADEWAARAALIRVTDVSQRREMKLARESRLALKEIRVSADHARKRLKEDSIRRGKAIDGIANVLKALIEPIEEHLLQQETFAERHEAAQRDALRSARQEALRALGADPALSADVGLMTEEAWSATLETAHLAHEARLEAARHAEAVRVEAERIAAEKREAARLEAIRLEAERAAREAERAAREAEQLAEVERLRAEAAEREKRAKAERAKAKAALAKAEEAARVEREAAEAIAAAERASAEKAAAVARIEREKVEAVAREEREARARVEAELAAAKAAEQARIEAEAEAARKAAAAPDREKLLALADAIEALPIPQLATESGIDIGMSVEARIGELARWLREKAGRL